MKVLITGGAGFIGSHTADGLLAKGNAVRILDILDPQIHGASGEFPSYLDPRIECIRGDVRKLSDVQAALDGVDAVMHFAALTGVGQSMYDIRSYVDTNCTGTATLIEAVVKRAAPIRKLILASSRAVYGEGSYACAKHGAVFPPVRRRTQLDAGEFRVLCPTCLAPMTPVETAEDRPLEPVSVYGWTKLQQEQYWRYAADTYGLPAVALRYFNVYGSRQSLKNPYTGVVTIFFNRIMSGQPISLYERGLPLRDFVHVSDVVQANLMALERDTPRGTCINVGAGNRVTIGEIAEALASACGRNADLRDSGEFRVGDIFACVADLARARSTLGYEPRMALRQGMEEFASWARDQESVDSYQKTVDELTRFGLFGRVGNPG